MQFILTITGNKITLRIKSAFAKIHKYINKVTTTRNEGTIMRNKVATVKYKVQIKTRNKVAITIKNKVTVKNTFTIVRL